MKLKYNQCTNTQFNQWVLEHFPTLSYTGEYSNNYTKLLFRCSKCGFEWLARPMDIKKGKGCKQCSNERVHDSQRKTHLQFEQEILDKFNGTIQIIGEYMGSNKRIEVQCKIDGHKWSPFAYSLIHGYGCIVCRNRQMREVRRHTTDTFINKLNKIHKDYKVIGKYGNNNTERVLIECPLGHQFMGHPGNLLQGQGCPQCRENKLHEHSLGYTPEQYQRLVAEISNQNIVVLGLYQGYQQHILHKCNKCNRIWSTTPNIILHGGGCPHCSKYISKAENQICDFITSYNIDTIQQSEIGNRLVDIYIPAHNLVIEYDGLYWHSEIKRNKKYHIEKYNDITITGCRLLQIREDEWLYKQDLVKDKLLNILGLNKNKLSIYARKCNFNTLTIKDARQFMNTNHIQGYCNSSYKIGLWYGNDLVALALFNKPQVSRNIKYKEVQGVELSRFATNIRFNIPGAFSKILKQALKQFSRIYTYADLRWVDPSNNVYVKNGFQEYSKNPPRYSYWTNIRSVANQFNININQCYYRCRFRKNAIYTVYPELRKKNLTEHEIMKYLKFHRIYDCGTRGYEIYAN